HALDALLRATAQRCSCRSPLLANLYMRRFVLGWKMLGLERSLGSRIVTYADDLVILCWKGKAEEALQRLREIMGKLSGVTVLCRYLSHHVLAHPRLAPDVGKAEEGERGTIRLRMVSPVWPVAAEIDEARLVGMER